MGPRAHIVTARRLEPKPRGASVTSPATAAAPDSRGRGRNLENLNDSGLGERSQSRAAGTHPSRDGPPASIRAGRTVTVVPVSRDGPAPDIA